MGASTEARIHMWVHEVNLNFGEINPCVFAVLLIFALFVSFVFLVDLLGW